MGNQHFNNIELETAWKLLETCIQPIITYGGETWEMTKQEEKRINQIQENIYIRRILMVPQSTPTESLYIETGLLDITTIVTKNRLNMEKKLHKHPEKLTSKIMELNTKNGWKDTTNKIKGNIKRTTQEINTGEINSRQLNNFFQKKSRTPVREKQKHNTY